MSQHHGRSAVRLFSGYAETPIWFVGGPVDYADSALSQELAMDLSDWEERSYGRDGLLIDRSERSEILLKELASRLADELGDGFVISVDGDAGPIMISSEMPPTNPDAAAAFTNMAAEEEKLRGVMDL